MAEINAPDLVLLGLCSIISLSFLTFHIWRFDKGRCLIPTKKDWFRNLLVYMLVISNLSFVAWSIGWGYVKVQLGWIKLQPGNFARPWPSALFPERFQHYHTPLVILFAICYGIQACLTVEEALYFAHLMRALRSPQAAVPFLRSNFFRAWVGSCVVIGVILQSTPWIGYDGSLKRQLSKELVGGGMLEFAVLIASTTVVLKVPRFLREVAAAGAGPEVRTRLYLYDQLNRCRTLFRFTFSLSMTILGIDGFTERARITMNPLAVDFLAAVIGCSLSAVIMISIVLYLPRSDPSSRLNRVMVGQQNQLMSGLALMSLLREGGMLDGTDDDLVPGEEERRVGDDAPFARMRTNGSSWKVDGEEVWEMQAPAQASGSKLLVDTFISPIAVSPEAQPQRPVQIHMQVEQQIHKD